MRFPVGESSDLESNLSKGGRSDRSHGGCPHRFKANAISNSISDSEGCAPRSNKPRAGGVHGQKPGCKSRNGLISKQMVQIEAVTGQIQSGDKTFGGCGISRGIIKVHA